MCFMSICHQEQFGVVKVKGQNMLAVWHLCLPLVLGTVFCEALVSSPPHITKPHSEEEILFQVVSRQDEDEKPFSIECEAEGEPSPIYRWRKNGRDFNWQLYEERISESPGRRGTLVINSPIDDDEGYYQCFAQNEWGTATSNIIYVRKIELGSFKLQDPITETVNEGDAIGLRCEPPDGYPKPNIFWIIQEETGSVRKINSTRMTVDPEGTLWFSNVTRGDQSNDFTYACAAEYANADVMEVGNRVNLRVNFSDRMAVQSENKPRRQFVSRKNTVVLKGKTLQLVCIYSGTPIPEILWKKGGGLLSLDRVQYEDYGKRLVIKNINFEDAGTYKCEAGNGVGAAKTYRMNVHVDASPYFINKPNIQIKDENEEVEFHCETSGIPPPVQKWTFNGIPIELVPYNPRRVIYPNKITIYNLTKADTGNYGCNITNTHGRAYKEGYINVLALPPSITTPLCDMGSVIGQTVIMTCPVFGAPKPQVRWLKNGETLSGVQFKISHSGNFTIEDAKFTDSGNYTCLAENRYGSAQANRYLLVMEKTVITSEPQNYEVAVGETVTFRCNAAADNDLDLKIHWMKDYQEIDFSTEPRYMQQSDSSLKITQVNKLDAGIYTCIANPEVSADAMLIVRDVPNPPRLVKVICNYRDAIVQWEPTGDNCAPILGYNIQYNTSFTPDKWEKVEVPAFSTHLALNLGPWANFTFRVIARNKIGPSEPSSHHSSQMCTTPKDVPYNNPENVEGKGSTPHNLVIRWSPMPEIDHNAPAFKYRIYWKRDDIANAQWSSEDVVDWQQDHMIINNQPTFKPYSIKVEAHNEKGQAKEAATVITGWSGENVPMAAPMNLTLVELRDARTALLSWVPVANTSIRGHYKGYKIKTWTESERDQDAREIILENHYEPMVLLDSFIPYSINFVCVYVFNGAYDGPPSEIIHFTTPEGVPGPINHLDAIPMGISAFFITWKMPKHPNGILTGYNIYFQEVKGIQVLEITERDPPINDPAVSSAKLAALKPNTRYRIIIKARTLAGEGTPYYIERSTQPIGPKLPGKPRLFWKPIHTIEGEASIKITWVPNLISNPGSHFYVQYKLHGASNFKMMKPELYNMFTIVKGLDSQKMYDMQLIAVDEQYQTPSDIAIVIPVFLAAPSNLYMLELIDATTALIGWEPVDKKSIKGYKIQTWTEGESEINAHEIIIENNNEGRAKVDLLAPYSRNFVRVLAFNGAYDGPPSETIIISTPEGVPGPIDALDVIPMGRNAFFITWKEPKNPNGILTGYNIFYQEIQGMELSELSQRDPSINDPSVKSAKLSSLNSDTKYRIIVKAKTSVGDGMEYYIERTTLSTGPTPPGKPTFIWRYINNIDGEPSIKVTWVPAIISNPGSHFYVQYKLYGTSDFLATRPVLYYLFTDLKGLDARKRYEVQIVSVDGEYETHSDIQQIFYN